MDEEENLEVVEPKQDFRFVGNEAPTMEDMENIAKSKYNVESYNSMMGTLASAGVEIGTGIGLSIYASKAANTMKWLNKAKYVSLAGVAAPEPTTTIAGGVGFLATEAAIWGFSNFLGQTTRKTFGIQDHYSGGEMIAAAVFGTTAATAQATKLIELGPSLKSLSAWKTTPIATETGKAMATGAGLGLAESLLRQEIQMALNERETRDVMDYAFSAGAGAGFNTLFSVFGRTGAWGLLKAADSAESALNIAKEQLTNAKKIKNPRRRRKEMLRANEAIRYLKEVETEFRGAAKLEQEYHNNAPEPEKLNNPSGDPRQAPKLEPLAPPPELTKLPEVKELSPIARDGETPDAPNTPDAPEAPTVDPEAPSTPDVDPTAPENPLDNMSYKELQAEAKKQGIKANLKKDELKKQLGEKQRSTPPKPDAPEAEEAPQVSPRRADIDSLKQRLIGNQEKRPLKIGEWLPVLQRESNQLKDQMEGELDYKGEDLLHRYQQGEDIDVAEIDELLSLVDDLRAHNDTDARLKTAEGRGMQANRSDAERYVWEGEISVRGIREDAALFDLQESLIQLRDGTEASTLEKDFESFFSTKDDVNKENYKTYVEGEKKNREIENLSPDEREAAIKNRVAATVQRSIQTLSKQLAFERRKMVEDTKFAMNDHQRKKLNEEVQKRAKENPKVQLLETQLKYYKDAQRELDQIEKKQAELNRLIKLETEGSVGQMRQEFESKAELLKKKSGKIEELNKKIADSKTRMRQFVKDIDRSRLEAQRHDVFMAMQAHAMRNIEASTSNKLVQFGRNVRTARKLALIDQLPSVLAGVPTGVGLALRSAIRPFVMAPLDIGRYGMDTGKELFISELKGLAETIVNWKGTGTSMFRTFQTGNSATDRVASKYMENMQASYLRTGNPTIKRAMKTAQARAKNQKDPMNTLLDFENNKGWAVLSLGVRGIASIDDGFRRQLLRGRLDTAARRKAILENPNNAEAAKASYENHMKTMWKERGGLDVLADYRHLLDDVNDINQNLLFSAQYEDLDLFHQNGGEQLIEMFSKYAKKDNALAFMIDAFMPYISVPLRGVYRGVRFAASPIAGVPRATMLNPYNAKIKDRQSKIEIGEQALLKTDPNSPDYKAKEAEIKTLRNEIEILETRKTKYAEDLIVDSAFGIGLVGLGATAAAVGEATGSLNWMTTDQQEKNKLKPFQLMGMDYSAAAPWAIPIAIGADLMAYAQAKDAGVLTEKQNALFMLSTTLVQLSEQVPMMQGFETFNAIIQGGLDSKAKLLGRMAATYVPIPAQIRKTLMAANEDQTIGDLRGGTFEQRAAYAFFGTKPINRKTDYFGDDIKSNKTWVQHAIIRQAPSKDDGVDTKFEEVLASDIYDNIQAAPSSLGNRIKLTDFIDEDGVTLQYAYAQRLKNFRMNYKGRKMTLKQAVNKLISSKKWKDKHKKMEISDTLQYNNEGLRELNSLMQQYYNAVKADIMDDDKFTKRFVNRKDESLFEVVSRRDVTVKGNTKTLRELIQYR